MSLIVSLAVLFLLKVRCDPLFATLAPLIDVQDIGFHLKPPRPSLRDCAMTLDTCLCLYLDQTSSQCATIVTTLIFRTCLLTGISYSDARKALLPSNYSRGSPQQPAVPVHRPPTHRCRYGHLQNLHGQSRREQQTSKVGTGRTQTEATYTLRVQDRLQASVSLQ